MSQANEVGALRDGKAQIGLQKELWATKTFRADLLYGPTFYFTLRKLNNGNDTSVERTRLKNLITPNQYRLSTDQLTIMIMEMKAPLPKIRSKIL